MEFGEKLKQAEKALDGALNELELLEEEKTSLINKYLNANEYEREEIEKAMKASEEKFKALSEDVHILGEKIKKLKTDN